MDLSIIVYYCQKWIESTFLSCYHLYERRRGRMKIAALKNKLLLTIIYGAVLLIFWTLRAPCFFEYLFHIPCPGCGMSWAMVCVLKFHFVEAFKSHPMFWSMPILYWFFLMDTETFKKRRSNWIILILIGAGFFINWIRQLC